LSGKRPDGATLEPLSRALRDGSATKPE
jgi:hypothetical protein